MGRGWLVGGWGGGVEGERKKRGRELTVAAAMVGWVDG